MLQALPKNLSLKEYLTYEDGTDTRYELVNGELVAMGQPTGQHAEMAEFLNDEFRNQIKRLALSLVSKQGAIALAMPQIEGKDTARIPDVCVVDAQLWEKMRKRTAAIALDESPPVMVVEIVSTNWRDDYLKKLADYESLGISEYWIVDYQALGAAHYIGTPKQPTVLVYQLVENEYQVSQVRDGDRIVSSTFPELTLTAEQVLSA